MNYLKQFTLLLLCCLCGDALSILVAHKLPGSVLGMMLLFLFLLTGVLQITQIENTADFLLQHMAFFFLPACLGILEIFPEIRTQILPIVAICLITTVTTALATALTVHLVFCITGQRGKEAFDHD